MNETRNTESQISTRGLDSEMEKKLENSKERVQEAINTLNAQYKSQQDDAKHICESLKYLRSKGQENSDLYNNLFRHLNNLSDEREVNRISVQRLEDYLEALV
tara:strand:- start:56 stop:364 length:309 start_codon:yes stop_codon:yes gene_type:complete